MNTSVPDFENPLCREIGQDLFFPEKNQQQEAIYAKSICKKCEHIAPCLEYGLRVEVKGIWGGESTAERARMADSKGIVRERLLTSADFYTQREMIHNE